MTTPEKTSQDNVPNNASKHSTDGTSAQSSNVSEQRAAFEQHSDFEQPAAFEQRARELFRLASDSVDHVTARRLRVARREALHAARLPQHHIARWLIPAGAFAAIALATLMVWQPRSPSSLPTVPAENASVLTAETDNDLPPDAEKTDPHLYQHMDFYKWLAANNVSGDAAGDQTVNH